MEDPLVLWILVLLAAAALTSLVAWLHSHWW